MKKTFLLIIGFLPFFSSNALKAEETQPTDAYARKFMLSCAGCHSLNGVKLNGPDLSSVAAWNPTDLKTAIKRMEKNTGAIATTDLDGLADLLKDPKVRDRIKAEEAKIVAQFAAKMDPPSANLGKSLFHGGSPLINGGIACSSCHEASGKGGNLGPNLNAIHSKMGDTALISAIEKSSFKIMEPHYRKHPVTKQEAMHINKYLSTLSNDTARAKDPIVPWVGLIASSIFLSGMIIFYRQHNYGVRTPLKRRK